MTGIDRTEEGVIDTDIIKNRLAKKALLSNTKKIVNNMQASCGIYTSP